MCHNELQAGSTPMQSSQQVIYGVVKGCWSYIYMFANVPVQKQNSVWDPGLQLITLPCLCSTTQYCALMRLASAPESHRCGNICGCILHNACLGLIRYYTRLYSTHAALHLSNWCSHTLRQLHDYFLISLMNPGSPEPRFYVHAFQGLQNHGLPKLSAKSTQ